MADHVGMWMTSFFPVEDAVKAREVLEDAKQKKATMKIRVFPRRRRRKIR